MLSRTNRHEFDCETVGKTNSRSNRVPQKPCGEALGVICHSESGVHVSPFSDPYAARKIRMIKIRRRTIMIAHHRFTACFQKKWLTKIVAEEAYVCIVFGNSQREWLLKLAQINAIHHEII